MFIQSLYTAQEQNYDYLTTYALEEGQISFRIDKSLDTTYFTYISYSKDNINWETLYNENDKTLKLTVDVSPGTLVYWRGKGTSISYLNTQFPPGNIATSTDRYSGFMSTCRFNVMGNVMSILFDDIDETTHQHRNPVEYNSINFTNETKYNGAFGNLFAFCNKLISAKNLKLNSNIVPISGYHYMFSNCTSLVDAPKLPCTNLTKHSCYWGMFTNCTSLVSAPELPATTITSHCYRAMFRDCTSLINVSDLPATTLITGNFTNFGYAYRDMFYNCTSLVTAPTINFTKLPKSSIEMFNNMFYNCKKLSYIHTKLKKIQKNIDFLKYWTVGVASNGTFVMPGDAQWFIEGYCGIPLNWNIEYEGDNTIAEQSKTNTLLNIKNTALKITALEPCKVTLTSKYINKSSLDFIRYSLDDGNSWNTVNYTYASLKKLIDVSLNNTNDTLLVYGDGVLYYNDDCPDQLQFNVTGNYKLSNYINTLLDPYEIHNTTSSYGGLFCNSSTLQDITELRIKYYPKTYHNTYNQLFANCTHITDCSNLILNTETIEGNNIYKSMFENCSSLIYGPTFKITKFSTNSSIFEETFKGCSSLKYIKALFPDKKPANNFTKDWVEGVPEGGLFVKNAECTSFVVSGNNGIPAGWDVSTI